MQRTVPSLMIAALCVSAIACSGRGNESATTGTSAQAATSTSVETFKAKINKEIADTRERYTVEPAWSEQVRGGKSVDNAEFGYSEAIRILGQIETQKNSMDTTDLRREVTELQREYALMYAAGAFSRAKAGTGNLEEIETAQRYLREARVERFEDTGFVPTEVRALAIAMIKKELDAEWMKELSAGDSDKVPLLHSRMEAYSLKPEDIGLTAAKIKEFDDALERR
ncbi:MAG: hypothetical protein KW804_02530 [Candidatus Doudnabacteria bacterium]|nr:hypothetical protein [Candidatus Doudnabacteria bacterium]